MLPNPVADPGGRGVTPPPPLPHANLTSCIFPLVHFTCGTYMLDSPNENPGFAPEIIDNITKTFLQIIQIQKRIPRTWTQILKKCTTTSNINNNVDNIPIKIDYKHTTIDYYKHLIKYKHYTPKTTVKLSITNPDFDNAEQKIWSRIV